MSQSSPTGLRAARLLAAAGALSLVAACGEEGANLSFLQPKKDSSEAVSSSSTRLVERDVEAPEVFQVEEAGLWDGRPSLGGVWVAHPDATDPERVIIRNNANGQFVIGALFRREREIPGPRIQASSDTAAALGMLAGAPVELNVTVLRREAVDDTPPAEDTRQADPIEEAAVVETAALETSSDAAPAEIAETPLDPIAGAAAAIEAAAPAPAAAAASSAPVPKPAAVAPAVASSLEKPFIQIGIFSVESNAKRTAAIMRDAGMIPTVLEQSSSGKPFWRVLVGPAQNKSERSALLKSVKDTGFTDAYAVTH